MLKRLLAMLLVVCMLTGMCVMPTWALDMGFDDLEGGGSVGGSDGDIDIPVAGEGTCGVIVVDKNAYPYPESSHNYENDADNTQVFTYPGAKSLTLTFAEESATEYSWDYVYVYDGSENQVAEYTGNFGNTVVTVPGDTVRIRLVSDGSVTYYGYAISSIETGEHSFVFTEQEAGSCTESRWVGQGICECGYIREGGITPPLGHSIDNGQCIRCGIYGVDAGMCGDAVYWLLDKEGTLTISGTGPMYDYEWRESPFYIRSDIKKVIIETGVTTIGDHAFIECTSLTSVTIGDGVATIGGYAFYRCYRLTSVTIPDSVTTIGEEAFCSCDSLTSVTIPDSVTIVGDHAFACCTSLTSVAIPDSVTTIGDYAFEYCTSLTSVTIGDSVTTIGEWAFNRCASLREVTIGDSVTTIGKSAFEYCASLTSVTIPDSVTTIGMYAFAHCDSLTSVTIPDSVTGIYSYAFYSCDSLTSMTIPDSVTTIGSYAFKYCTSLTGIWVSENNPNYSSDEAGVLFNKDKIKLLYAPAKISGAYTIPDSVTTIGYEAFYSCDSLTSVTIPDSVTTIGDYAFYYCTSLTSVTMGDSVTTIGRYAFYCCSRLTSVTIPDSVTTIGSYAFLGCDSLISVTIPDSVTAIEYEAFAFCDSLREVTIGDSVTTIGMYAFESCTSLTNVTIPNSVTAIGYSAFKSCTSLTDVYYGGTEEQWNAIDIGSDNKELLKANIHFIGHTHSFVNYVSDNNATCTTHGTKTAKCEVCDETNTVTDFGSALGHSYTDGVCGTCGEADPDYGAPTEPAGPAIVESGSCGENVFYTLDEEGSLTISGTGPMYDYEWRESLFYIRSDIKKVIIETGVTTIGESAFESCTSLTSVTIPDSVTTIGEGAFYRCANVREVTIPDSVTTIGGHAFYYCTRLTSMTIPDSVTTINNSSFAYCTSLTSVTIPDSVTTIGEEAFYNCTSLTSVTIPDSVTTIMLAAFAYCSSLTEVTIPDSVTTIGNSVFCCCINLTSVTIPDSVTTIGARVFYNCDSLTNVTIPDSVTTIGEDAFSSCDSLTSVTIPDSVTTIGYEAFAHCLGLREVTIPDSVTTIGLYAFEGCTSLTEVSIPDSVTTIGARAFHLCDSLTGVWVSENNPNYSSDSHGVLFNKDKTTLIQAHEGIPGTYTIPGSITAIKNYAFYACDSLTSVTIPAGVTTIGVFTFYDCDGLTSVTIPDSVTTIGDYAFHNCDSLTDVYYGGTEEQWNAMNITNNNHSLLNATIHFEATEPEATEPEATEPTVPDTDDFIDNSSISDKFAEGTTVATCPVCKVSVEWVELPEITEQTVLAAGTHYYLSKDLYNTDVYNVGAGSEVTVHLNGYNITGTKSVFSTLSSTTAGNSNLIVLGKGEVSTAGNSAVMMLKGDAHLFGGTYTHRTGSTVTIAIQRAAATVNMYAGAKITVDTENGGTGGALAILYGRFNMYGGEISNGSVKNPHMGNVQHHFNMYGGTISGGIEVTRGSATNEFSISGDSVITADNGGLTITEGSKLVVGELGENASIAVTATGVFTETLTDAESVLPHFVSAVSTKEITIADNALTCTDKAGIVETGSCGENVAWTLDREGTLTISGTGPTNDYGDGGMFGAYDGMKTVIIQDGVTTIGTELFAGCSNLISVTIPNSVTTIGVGAFSGCTALTDVYYGGTEEQWNAINVGNSNDYLLNATIHFAEHTHSFINYVSDNNATCTTDGTKTAKCDGCDETNTVTDFGSALGHSFTNYVSDNNATCTEDGTKTAKCDRCDVTETVADEGSKLGHSFSNYISDHNATCTADGTKTAKCDGCDETNTVTDFGSALGHSYTDGVCGTCGEADPDYVAPTEPAGPTIVESGSCGENVFYTLDEEGTLTISGTGPMYDYSFNSSPFDSHTDIRKVVIKNGVTTIDNSAFYSCTSLREVTIPNSVITIGDYAFGGCTSLTDVTIGESVTTIGDYAFSRCNSLTEVTIPDSVTTIGSCAFENCDSLTNVTIPNSVITIGNYAFDECTSLTGIWISENNPNYSSDKYGVLFNKDKTTLIQAPGGIVGAYTIPNSVTTIGMNAFDECTSLTNVTIPNSVITIGDYAFVDCTSLTSVTIGNGVTTIGTCAFCDCTSLTGVVIPDSVTTIGYQAFERCTSLTSVTIGDSVTTIEDYAFSNCDSLTGIWASENNPNYSSDQYGVLFNKDKTTLIHAPGGIVGAYTIPNSVTTIGMDAFEFCTSLTSVTIGNSVTTIGSYAFFFCTSLTDVVIPDSVTGINYFSFASCTSLTNVYYSGTNEQWNAINIGGYNNPLLNATIHFVEHTHSFVNYVSDNNATCTADGTKTAKCDGCDETNTITDEGSALGHSYTDGVCGTCGKADPDYVAPTEPAGPTIVESGSCGENVFYTLDEEGTLTISGTGPMYDYSFNSSPFDSHTDIRKVVIKNGVTTVGGQAFYGCTSLTSVTIPDSVTSIGSSVFSGCSALESMTIPFVGGSRKTASDTYQYPFGYIFGTSSYTGGVATKQYYYGSSTSSTTYNTYYIPSSLKTVTVTGGEILYGAFRNCSSLTGVTIGDSVTVILSCAFSFCTSLTSVTIPDSVITIGDYAFGECTSLTDVTIGESVTTIGSSAFEHCSSLTSVTIGNSVTTIGSYAFYFCTSLTDVVIPDSVTTIGKAAFSSCTSLTQVTIPDSVTSIGDSAFWGCSSLTSVTIGNGVTSIGSSAFDGCYSLTDVYYGGTEQQWNAISIDSNNQYLLNATIHFAEHTHSFVNYVSDNNATCTADGTKTAKCDGCDETNTITDEGSKLDHSFTNYVSDGNATCTADGTKTAKCDNCDETNTITDEGSALGHRFTNYVSDNNATCTVDGTKTAKCDRCDVTETVADEGSKLGHSFSNYISDNNATCTADGTKTAKCDNCDETNTITDEGSKLDHSFTNYVSDGNATCTADGTKTAKCQNCTATDTVTDTGSKLEHSYVNGSCEHCQDTPAGVQITRQPESVTALDGTEVTVSFEAEGEGLTYKWYYRAKGTTKFNLTNSFKSNTYTTVINASRDGREIYCVVTDKYGNSVQTDTVSLNIKEEQTLKITRQPESVTAADGTEVTVSFEAEGEGLTYKWYYRAKGTTKFNLTNSFKSNTYTTVINASRDGREIYCVVTDKYGNSVQTDIVSLNLQSITELKITRQPESVTGAIGETLRVDFEAEGEGLTYRWYYKDKNVAKFSMTATFKSNYYTAVMSTARDGRQIYCVVTDLYGNSVQTDTVTLSAIHVHIFDIYEETENGYMVAQCTCGAYDVKTEDLCANGHSFTKYVSDGNATCDSNGTKTAKCDNCKEEKTVLDVGSKLPHSFGNYTTIANGVTMATCSECGALDVKINNPCANGHSFTNYISDGNATCDSNGTKTAKCDNCDREKTVLDVGSKLPHTYENGICTGCGDKEDITTVQIIKQPVSVTVAGGEMATVSVTAVGDGLTYKWYYRAKGTTTFNVTNSFKTNVYEVEMTAARNGREVYCVVIDKYGNSVQTDVVSLNMAAESVSKVTITRQPESVCVAEGENVTISFTAEGEGLTYKWYYRAKGTVNFVYTNTFKSNTYTTQVTASRNGREIYCVVTDKYGNSVQTDVVSLNIKQAADELKITKQPVDVSAPSGQNAVVTFTAEGEGLTYKWYYKDKTATKFTATNSFTSNTYSAVMGNLRTGRQVYCVVTDQYGNSVQTNTVTLTMQ